MTSQPVNKAFKGIVIGTLLGVCAWVAMYSVFLFVVWVMT